MSSDQNGHSKILFWGCFIALVTTSFGFITRMFLFGDADFTEGKLGLDPVEVGRYRGIQIWPFAISIIGFSLIIDKVGYKFSMVFAAVCQLIWAVMGIAGLSVRVVTRDQGAITDVLNLANEAGDPMEGSKVRKARGRHIESSNTSPKKKDVASAESLPDITITHTSYSPAVKSGQYDTVIDPALTQTLPIHEPLTALVEDAETPLPLVPTLYSLGDHPACIIPQELGPILWSSSQPSLSPDSFISRLTYTCFNVGCLVLSKSIEAPVPLSDEYRMFGSTLRYRDRDEMIFRMRWLLGPGTNELQLLAELPWGGRWWDQEFSSTELCNYATIDSSAPQFLSVVGVEKQLMALGARLVDRETIELDSSGLTVLSETRQEPTCTQPDSWSFVNLFPSETPRPRIYPPRLLVSVNSLIHNLSQIAVCLMKGPGFPRQALRNAIEASVVTRRNSGGKQGMACMGTPRF